MRGASAQDPASSTGADEQLDDVTPEASCQLLLDRVLSFRCLSTSRRPGHGGKGRDNKFCTSCCPHLEFCFDRFGSNVPAEVWGTVDQC